jgi:hypothetical protein
MPDIHAWSEAHDILLTPEVAIQNSQRGGRGVFAMDDVPSHHPVAIIPGHMTINPTHADLKAILDSHQFKIASNT